MTQSVLPDSNLNSTLLSTANIRSTMSSLTSSSSLSNAMSSSLLKHTTMNTPQTTTSSSTSSTSMSLTSPASTAAPGSPALPSPSISEPLDLYDNDNHAAETTTISSLSLRTSPIMPKSSTLAFFAHDNNTKSSTLITTTTTTTTATIEQRALQKTPEQQARLSFSSAATPSPFQKTEIPAVRPVNGRAVSKPEALTFSSASSSSPSPVRFPHQQDVNHSIISAASPTSPTSPLTKAHHSHLYEQDSMYSNNGSNGISTNGVLRSPSLSSGSGSGPNGGASSTSASSATTTMTTTHSSTLIGNNSAATVGSLAGGAGVSEMKLKRFLEHNQRLKEQLDMRRITVSEASQSLIKFATDTKDSLLPSLWGNAPSDPFSKQSTGCCTIS